MKHKISIGLSLAFLLSVFSIGVGISAENGGYSVYLPLINLVPTWQEVGAGSASGGGISNSVWGAYHPSIAIAPDGAPYVTWRNFGSNTEIYVRTWNGSSWAEVGAGSASGTGISNSPYQALTPSIAVAPNNTPYVAWMENNTVLPAEIYVRAWNGSSWAEVGAGSASGGGISNSVWGAYHPSIAIAPDGTPFVAWLEYSNGQHIYVRAWNGNSWVEVGAGSASGGGISGTGESHSPSIAVAPDGTPYVAWTNINDLVHDIYVRAWDGSSWVEVGAGSASGGGISGTGASFTPSIAIAPDGTPYVAWDESSNGFKVYVRAWDGSSWTEVGAGSASGGGISGFGSGGGSIAIASDGTPYVAWENINEGIYVRAWDGNNWAEVGAGSASGGGISNTAGGNPSIAIAPNGTPFVAWNSNQIFVLHYTY